ncbi:hypothetical protein RCS94_01855 [Orbaceae bacterium ac157xtp]
MPFCAVSLFVAPSSYGVLSATSANTIQGHKPGFSGQSGAKKLGFKVGNISYSEANPVLGGSNTDKDKIEPGTPKLFDPSLRLEDFKVQNFTENDFTIATDYYDADGDDANPTTPFTIVGTVSHEWLDGNGDVILDETKMIGCGGGLTPPLTLKINLVAQSHSRYGNPRDSDPAGLEQRYQIKAPTSGFCFAKPNSLDYHNGATPHPMGGGGYASAQFDPDNGFKASLNPKFPTTGFPGATFTLIMVGNPTDYTFTHNGGGAVTVGTDGKVTLNSKLGGGGVTIKAKFNATSQIHEYTLNPTTVWVVPKLNPATALEPYDPYAYTYANAITACRGESNIPTRADLTNAPQSIDYIGSGGVNFYTRAVGGGVFGEWGKTTRSIYPGSRWYDGGYWTRETWIGQLLVNPKNGQVFHYGATSLFWVACLE